MIPLWAITGIGAAAVAGMAGFHFGGLGPKAQLERERTAWATSQANALADEIKRSNETIEQLRANHAQATERAAKAESEAQAASSAAAAAHTMARRVRDASATDLLAARAAIESAGATAACGPALDAADLRDKLFARCVDAAQGMGSQLAAVGRYADALKGDDAACRRDYETVTR